jgi:hypothetical protein
MGLLTSALARLGSPLGGCWSRRWPFVDPDQRPPRPTPARAGRPSPTLKAAGRLLLLLLCSHLLAPPARAAEETPLRLVTADTVSYDDARQCLLAQGGVVVEYRDYRITADVLEWDFAERVATFRGRVALTTPERLMHGTLLSLNLKSRAYSLEGARIQLPPEELQLGAQEPLYATGARVSGVPGEVDVEYGGITSCDLGSPHYLLDAKRIDLIPGRRLTARKVSLYALGHKLITLPGLSIPLHTVTAESSRLVPLVGQSFDEGYYLKSAYFYVLGALVGNLRLDLMSKKGIGFGLDQPYDFDNFSGGLHVYQLNNREQNRQDLNVRMNHQHQLGQFNIRFGGDYRRNSLPYVTSASTSLLTDLGISRRTADGTSTDLGINRSENSYGDRTTGNWLARLHHNQTIAGVRANLSLDLSQPFGLSTASSGRLSSRLDLNRPGDAFDVGMLVDRIDTLGGTANYFTGVQHLPELRIATDSSRLFKRGFLAERLPLSAELRLGNLREAGYSMGAGDGSDMKERIRTYLHLRANPLLSSGRSPLSLQLPLEFTQAVYGADEAQWLAGVSPSLIYRIAEASQLSLSYSLMKQNGYTPFQFDYGTEYNSLNLSLTLGSRLRPSYSGYGGYGAYGSYGAYGGYGGYPAQEGYQSDSHGSATRRTWGLDPQMAGKASFTLDTGYDFENDIARDLVVRLNYQPTAHHQFGISTAYDWLGKSRFGSQKRLRDVRLRWRTDYGDALQLSVGAIWDTNRGRLGTIRTQLSSQLTRHWRLDSLYGNNATGFGTSQPYTQVMLTRDLHCLEASAIFREETVFGRKERDLRFVLSIKAFPVNKEFGLSRSGQYLSTDVGEIF